MRRRRRRPPTRPRIQLAQDIWGKDPALKDAVANDEDVDGLISDAMFVGLPGNITFFTGKGNLSGFPFKRPRPWCCRTTRLDAAVQDQDPKRLRRRPTSTTTPCGSSAASTARRSPQGRISPEFKFDDVKEKTIYSFNIYFDPNKSEFPEAQYGKDFQRALEEASLFGNAVVAIRGHATPACLIDRFLDVGQEKRPAQVRRATGVYTFAADGKPLDLTNIKNVLDAIDKNPDLAIHGRRRQDAPAERGGEGLQELSEERAKAVRDIDRQVTPSRKGLVLDESQMRSQGVGVKEPLYANPTADEQSAKNRRVEFSIIKVPADKVKTDEFGL